MHIDMDKFCRALLTGFLPIEFQQMLNLEIVKVQPPEAIMTAVIDTNSWVVHTNMVGVYSNLGCYVDESLQQISHIAIDVQICSGTCPIGQPKKIRYSPQLGFYDLQKVVALAHREKQDRQAQGQDLSDGKNVFSATRIMNERYTEAIEEVDDRIVQVQEALVAMGYSRKSALDHATLAVNVHPNEYNVDKLIEIATGHK